MEQFNILHFYINALPKQRESWLWQNTAARHSTNKLLVELGSIF